jgi:hypothetical protein
LPIKPKDGIWKRKTEPSSGTSYRPAFARPVPTTCAISSQPGFHAFYLPSFFLSSGMDI